jgi:hypothetical protein
MLSEATEGDSMLLCTQERQAEDDCCTTDVCGEPAVWRHEVSGLGMCAEHEGNVREWGHATPGEWRVGATKVSYPEGWTNLEDGSSPPELVVAEEPKPASGLILDLS